MRRPIPPAPAPAILAVATLAMLLLPPTPALATRPELPPADCTALAGRMLRAGRLPAPVRNAAAFPSWRATCAPAPPRGTGPLRLLCEAALDPAAGTPGRIVFWERIDVGRFTTGSTPCRSRP